MRRSVAAAVVALSTALSVSASPWTALAGSSGATRGPDGRATAATRTVAVQALHTVTRVLAGRGAHTDASMALLRLRLTMNALAPADRRHAAAILARPTDHPDVYGQTYRVKAKRECAGHICVHWVPTTRDAPPGRKWVDKQLRMLNHVWDVEVKKLGYRRPISDGNRGGGGSGKFDVYLKELYHQGLYGLTVAEQRTSSNRRLYSSYLVIDNDFKRSQFHADPMQVARVTAAHEFFHAIQFGYDAGEDPWLMEATATWMEDQFDDSSNDNRQYLPWSQLHEPATPLDTFTDGGFEQYGNWVFFEYLSEHYGRGIVRSVWKHAAAFGRAGHHFSAEAIHSALHRHGGMTTVFGTYASGNTVPRHTYAEGKAYPAAGAARKVTLTRSAPEAPWATYAVQHLASVNLKAVPGTDLSGHRWRLRIKVDGPRRGTSPAVVVLVRRTHHPMTRSLVPLTRQGRGKLSVPFSRSGTGQVTVTLVNASTRFSCHTNGGYSCDGTPKAPHPSFAVKLVAYRR
jgi:hypothetical protein